MTTNLQQLGYVIRQTREAAGLTQAELGNKLAVSRTTIGLLETGQVKYPRIDMLIAIAEVLDIPSTTLLGPAGVRSPDAASAQLQWLASQLDDEGNETLIELGHVLVRLAQRRKALAADPTNARDCDPADDDLSSV